MFQIRPQQYDALGSASRDQFEDQLVVELEDEHPEVVGPMPEADLRARVREAVDRALGYDIRAETDVAAFVGFTFEFGAHFETTEEHRWARDVLVDPQLDGHRKVEMVRDRLEEFEGEAEDPDDDLDSEPPPDDFPDLLPD